MLNSILKKLEVLKSKENGKTVIFVVDFSHFKYPVGTIIDLCGVFFIHAFE